MHPAQPLFIRACSHPPVHTAPLGAAPWHRVGQRVNGVGAGACSAVEGRGRAQEPVSSVPAAQDLLGTSLAARGCTALPKTRVFSLRGFQLCSWEGDRQQSGAVLCPQRGDRCCSHHPFLVSCTCWQQTSWKRIARASFPRSFVIFQAKMLRFHFRRGFPCPARGFPCKA